MQNCQHEVTVTGLCVTKCASLGLTTIHLFTKFTLAYPTVRRVATVATVDVVSWNHTRPHFELVVFECNANDDRAVQYDSKHAPHDGHRFTILHSEISGV